MAYCPEDGALMDTVCLHFNACYDCLDCGLHWNYVDGSYKVGNTENCPVHNHCTTCQARTKLLYNDSADL